MKPKPPDDFLLLALETLVAPGPAQALFANLGFLAGGACLAIGGFLIAPWTGFMLIGLMLTIGCALWRWCQIARGGDK